MIRKLAVPAALAVAAACSTPAVAAPPSVEMTWMSIANWYFKIGDKRIVMDGYITRVPESLFVASSVFPKDMYTYTKGPYGVDLPAIGKRPERDARHRQARPAARRPRPLGPQLGHAGVVADDRRADDRQPLGVPAGECAGRHGRRMPHRQRRREDRPRRRHHDARRALEPQRRQRPIRSSTSRASCTGRRFPTRDRRPARRRRRGLSERRRQPRVPLHRRLARRPALVLRQQLGERVRPRQGRHRRRRQLRLAARQSRGGDEGRRPDAGRRLDRAPAASRSRRWSCR